MATGDRKYSFVITTIEESPFCVLIQNRVWQLRILMLFPADFFYHLLCYFNFDL